MIKSFSIVQQIANENMSNDIDFLIKKSYQSDKELYTGKMY